MKIFLKKSDFPIPIDGPIRVKVYQDYDKLDALAAKRDYRAIECRDDEHISAPGNVGAQNGNLHCGWIATMGDSEHQVDKMIECLNDKVKTCLERGEKIIVGFNQTGWFSIGYSIYVKNGTKEVEREHLQVGAAKSDRM